MAKVGKLTKLKSVLKKLNSFGKRHHSMVAASASSRSSYEENTTDSQLFPVYVGKSRRRYLVTSDVICNPVFRELVDRSGGQGSDLVVTVGCEVVMFEHLLWMLENVDHHEEDSHDELVEYYAC